MRLVGKSHIFAACFVLRAKLTSHKVIHWRVLSAATINVILKQLF